jgi:hypothetical protein
LPRPDLLRSLGSGRRAGRVQTEHNEIRLESKQKRNTMSAPADQPQICWPSLPAPLARGPQASWARPGALNCLRQAERDWMGLVVIC